jgi:hypothetical protein
MEGRLGIVPHLRKRETWEHLHPVECRDKSGQRKQASYTHVLSMHREGQIRIPKASERRALTNWKEAEGGRDKSGLRKEGKRAKGTHKLSGAESRPSQGTERM